MSNDIVKSALDNSFLRSLNVDIQKMMLRRSMSDTNFLAIINEPSNNTDKIKWLNM